LARLSCDAVLYKVLTSPTGAVLDLGRAVRTVTPAQRRALTARDRGCIIPGCTAPLAACDAHHIHYWRHGGRTDITNVRSL
jgi:N-acyl-D-aspartate/D-glutamate deacylase